MKSKRFLSLFICIIITVTNLVGCTLTDPLTNEPQTQAESFFDCFNTVSGIFSYKGDSPDEFAANCLAVKTLALEYHKLFDIYYEYAGINNLKTVNKNAGISPVKVDTRLIDFLIYCKELYTLTNGETNIALGAVLKLWHNAREAAKSNPENAYTPTQAELEMAAMHTDINNIIINKDESTVYISDPEMSIDVGAIGKGYATEKAAELLISRGVTSYVLNFGGNIRAIGEKVNGNGWTTGITNPDQSSDDSFICKVNIKDISLVTSGDYQRFYYVGDQKYHHIIDKDTNMPSVYFSAVSVFTKNSGLADALSTALFCMSYEDGLSLISSIGNVDAIWVLPDGTVKMTNGIDLVNE